MPLPAILPFLPFIAGAASQGANAIMQAGTNRRSRQFAREQYWRQREDALSDWEMQNAYNAPQAQMQRLEAAGLNPHLVYGQGAVANSSQPPRSSSAQGAPAQAPRIDLQEPFMGYADMRIKNATADNLAEQKRLMELEGLVKLMNIKKIDAETKYKDVATARGKFELDLRSSNSEALAGIIQQQLKKMQADTQFTLNQDERNAALNASNLAEAAERILSIRQGIAKSKDEQNEIAARIRNLDKDTELKKADIVLREKGIYPGDPLWLRALIQWLQTGKALEIFDGKKLNLFGASDDLPAVERIRRRNQRFSDSTIQNFKFQP